jgi:hypothetical protein
MKLNRFLLIVYSLLVFLTELCLGVFDWKVVGLYMETRKIGGIPCVPFYCTSPSWFLALAMLVAPLILGYLVVERYDFIREHAKGHLLFGLLVIPAGICGKPTGGGGVGVLYFVGLAAGLSYLLQGDHYRKNQLELVLLTLTWLFVGYAMVLKPWMC